MLLFKKRRIRKRKSKESEVSIFRSNGAGCTKCMCTEIKPDRYRLYELPLLFFLIRPYRCAHYKGHRFYKLIPLTWFRRWITEDEVVRNKDD